MRVPGSARGSTGLACECCAALVRACRGALRPAVQALRPAARACAAPCFGCGARAGIIAFAFGDTILPEVQATVGGDAKKTMCAPRRPAASAAPRSSHADRPLWRCPWKCSVMSREIARPIRPSCRMHHSCREGRLEGPGIAHAQTGRGLSCQACAGQVQGRDHGLLHHPQLVHHRGRGGCGAPLAALC